MPSSGEEEEALINAHAQAPHSLSSRTGLVSRYFLTANLESLSFLGPDLDIGSTNES